jgi:hypothetical protein
MVIAVCAETTPGCHTAEYVPDGVSGGRLKVGSPFEKNAATEPFVIGAPQSSFNCTLNTAGKLAGKEKLFTVPTGVMAIRLGAQPAAFGVTARLELDELCGGTTRVTFTDRNWAPIEIWMAPVYIPGVRIAGFTETFSTAGLEREVVVEVEVSLSQGVPSLVTAEAWNATGVELPA